MYCECTIDACASGFGQYQMGEVYSQPQYESEEDVISAITEQGIEVYELGVDELPAEAEDIRGRIHSEAGRIFCYLVDGHEGMEPRYFAIVETK